MKVQIEDYINRIIISVFLFSFCQIVNSQTKLRKILPPDEGVYHTAFSQFFSPNGYITKDEVINFESLVEKKIVWLNFSNEWFDGIKFPKESVWNIFSQGCIPSVRLLPRASFRNNFDKTFSLEKIIAGEFDEELIQWAQDAKQLGIPIMVDFAAEPNGDWFPWCAVYNGGGTKDVYGDKTIPDGPEKFRDAYRHIINLFRKEKADNVTWVFHLNAFPGPDEDWNKYKYYYPGDDYIDWIGVSIYGPQKWNDPFMKFADMLERIYPELCGLSKDKPLAILEFGVADYLPNVNKAQWIQDALYAITFLQYDRIKSIGWWNSTWWNEDGTMSAIQIDSSPESLRFYKEGIAQPFFVGEVKLGK